MIFDQMQITELGNRGHWSYSGGNWRGGGSCSNQRANALQKAGLRRHDGGVAAELEVVTAPAHPTTETGAYPAEEKDVSADQLEGRPIGAQRLSAQNTHR